MRVGCGFIMVVDRVDLLELNWMYGVFTGGFSFIQKPKKR